MRAGRRTPQATGPHRGTAHAPAPAVLSGSPLTTTAGGSPPPECDAENTSLRENPRARTQPRPPPTSTPPPGPVPTSGAGPRAKQTLLRATREEAGPPSPSPGAPGREAPLPAHRGGPSPRPGAGWGGVGGVAGHGEMLVDPARPPQTSDLERRDGHPPQKPREPISGDSRTSLGLGVPGTVTASVAGP